MIPIEVGRNRRLQQLQHEIDIATGKWEENVNRRENQAGNANRPTTVRMVYFTFSRRKPLSRRLRSSV
jgi:hypothetical protein